MDATERAADGRGGRASALALVGLAGAALLAAAQHDRPPRRSPEAILAEFEAVPYPLGVEGNDPQAQADFLRAIEAGTREQGRLALELHATHPDHPEVPRVMGLRWHLMRTNLGETERVLLETARALSSDADPRLRRVARERRAHAAIWSQATTLTEVLALVDGALAVTDSRWGSWILWDLALQRLPEPQEQRAALVRMQEDFPSAGWDADVRLHERLLDRVGDPLSLEFEDVLSGRRIGEAELRGNEVVVLMALTSNQIDALDGAGPVRQIAAWQASGHARQPLVVCIWRRPSSDLAAATDRVRAVTEQARIVWRVGLDHVGSQGGSWVEAQAPAITPLFLLIDADGRLARASMRLATLLEP